MNSQFNVAGNLKGVAGFRNKMNYTHTKIGAGVQPHQPLVLIVYPTQMISTYDLFRIVVFVVTTRRAPVNSIS